MGQHDRPSGRSRSASQDHVANRNLDPHRFATLTNGPEDRPAIKQLLYDQRSREVPASNGKRRTTLDCLGNAPVAGSGWPIGAVDP